MVMQLWLCVQVWMDHHRPRYDVVEGLIIPTLSVLENTLTLSETNLLHRLRQFFQETSTKIIPEERNLLEKRPVRTKH
jgi:hypothetical protein